MTAEQRDRITSEDYTDLIIEYRDNPQLLTGFTNATVQIMNDAYAIVYVPASQLTSTSQSFRYSEIPNMYALTDRAALEATGVDRLREMPNFNLRGEGVLVCVIDTGIDYTNPIFKNADGTTRIASIWDQTIDSTDRFPADIGFGTVYSREEINRALKNANPFSIVPSKDEIGHGTMMAGIAAGNEVPDQNFYGIAPASEFLIIKLRQAKKPLRDFYIIPDNVVCFQENHIMWGVHYCIEVSRQLKRPMVICLGVGTSQDSHDGESPLSAMTSIISTFRGTVVVTGIGNEGNRGRHFFGMIDPSVGNLPVELNVGENEKGFSMQLWGNAPGIFSIDILSPTGEYIPRIPAGIRVSRVISFIFEKTIINVSYETVESQTGDQLIFLRFNNVSSGTWRITVYGQGDLAAGFHMWLPNGDFITNDTYFIQPNIYTTLLAPGSADTLITVTAYNPVNSNLYVNSSRGYARDNVVKPEFAAPGVNYTAPNLSQTFTKFTGTSISAAHTAGVAALALEWGIIKGNQTNMNTVVVKSYLVRGAKRSQNLTYPNRDWGYGILDVYNVFNILRAEISSTT